MPKAAAPTWGGPPLKEMDPASPSELGGLQASAKNARQILQASVLPEPDSPEIKIASLLDFPTILSSKFFEMP